MKKTKKIKKIKKIKAKTAKPLIAGVKLAPDGYYYMKDPERPGKYLRVVPTSGPSRRADNVRRTEQ